MNMAGPPPYSPPAPRKNSNTVLIVVLICVVVIPCIGLLAVVALGYRFVTGTAFPLAGCMLTTKSAQQALNSYALEKGAYPKAETWQDDIKEHYNRAMAQFTKEEAPFPIPKAEDTWTCQPGDKPTGLAYNSDLAGKKPADIKDKYKTVIIFETDKAGRNLHEKYSPKPKSTSPTIMGAPRGWIFVNIEGEVDGFEGKK